MKTKTFNYYCDPSHGWVKAPVSLLKDLQIEKEITSFSYYRGGFAYLEEDMDASLLHKKLEEKGVEVKYKEFHTNKSSKIRNYNCYCHRAIFGFFQE